MKTFKIKKYLKRMVDKRKIMLDFPHIWLCLIIVLFSSVALVISYILELRELNYVASIFANIFAGLITGLIICLLSGIKQMTISKLNSKKKWLLHIHDMLNDYNTFYRELHVKPFAKYDGSEELFNFIYDVGSHANWINEDIIQSSFNKTLSFDPNDYCKKYFNNNALELSDDFNKLHDNLSMIDIDNPGKKEILEYFEKVDRNLRMLRISVNTSLEEIEIKLKTLYTTIV